MELMIIGTILPLLIVWFISVQHRLVTMEENINNTMSQIVVHRSSRFDTLTALADLAKGYTSQTTD